jgi:hypothetical protein
MSLEYPHQLVAKLKHVVPKTYNDKLAPSSSRPTRCLQISSLSLPANTILNVLAYNRDVLIVQCCIYLIHTIQRTWLEHMKSENQAQTRKCLLSSRELRHLLP